MKLLVSILFRACAGSIIICVLMEAVTVLGVVCGGIAGLFFSFFAHRIQDRGHRNFWGFWAFRYYVLLFRDIISSTFAVIRSIFYKKQPTISIYKNTAHVGERGKVLVANSITLTPGTITLEERDDHYTILSLNHSDGEDNSRHISETFETRIPETLHK